MKFLDQAKILVLSGKGGPGCISFRRETHVPRGGPDGGNGGKGGDVIFSCEDHINSLLKYRFKKKFKAGNGMQGSGRCQSGADGEDLHLAVPPGTLLINAETNEILADIQMGETFTALTGGRGGKGNTHFKTSVNQAPDVAQPGEDEHALELILELKLIADIGLIGFPSAGKSTLISRISAARPKVADYPFTTLTPNLGVVKVDDIKSFVVADIPGLIPDAHKGVGLGIEFLKHIERTKAFVHLVDISEMTQRDPVEDYKAIRYELESYDKTHHGSLLRSLKENPEIVVLNKIDAVQPERLEEVKNKFYEIGIKPLLLSAVTGQGLPGLNAAMSKLVFGTE